MQDRSKNLKRAAISAVDNDYYRVIFEDYGDSEHKKDLHPVDDKSSGNDDNKSLSKFKLNKSINEDIKKEMDTSMKPIDGHLSHRAMLKEMKQAILRPPLPQAPRTGIEGAISVLQNVRLQEQRFNTNNMKTGPSSPDYSQSRPLSPQQQEKLPQKLQLTIPTLTTSPQDKLQKVKAYSYSPQSRNRLMKYVESLNSGGVGINNCKLTPKENATATYSTDTGKILEVIGDDDISYNDDSSSESEGDDYYYYAQRQRQWTLDNSNARSPRQKVPMEMKPKGLLSSETQTQAQIRTLKSPHSYHHSHTQEEVQKQNDHINRPNVITTLKDMVKVGGGDMRAQLRKQREDEAEMVLQEAYSMNANFIFEREAEKQMTETMVNKTLISDSYDYKQQNILGNVTSSSTGNSHSQRNKNGSGKGTHASAAFLMLFTSRRVKRIIGEACANVQFKIVNNRKTIDNEMKRRNDAATKLCKSWKLYRWKRFTWVLKNYLYWNRQYEAEKDAKEEDEYRLRIAKRLIIENEFFHGISGNNLTGPKQSATNVKLKKAPAESLCNPNYSLYLRHKLALKEANENWIQSQAQRQVDYNAETAAKWEYKQTLWEEKVKMKKEKEHLATAIAFLAPKHKREKFGAKKKKKKKKKKKGLKGPGVYDFDDPSFWDNATPIITGTSDAWNKTSVYKDIYQGRTKPIKEKAISEKKKEKKISGTSSDESDSNSDDDDDDDDDDEQEYVNENERLLKKDYIAHWVQSLSVNVGGLGPVGPDGVPQRGISGYGHLDVPVNPYTNAEVNPYGSLPRGRSGQSNQNQSNGPKVRSLAGGINNYFNFARATADATFSDNFVNMARRQPDEFYDYMSNFNGKNIQGSVLSSKIRSIQDNVNLTDDEKHKKIANLIRTYGKTNDNEKSNNDRLKPHPPNMGYVNWNNQKPAITLDDEESLRIKRNAASYRNDSDVPVDWERAALVDKDYERRHTLMQLNRYPQYHSGIDPYAYNNTFTEYFTIKKPAKKKTRTKMKSRKAGKQKRNNNNSDDNGNTKVMTLQDMVNSDELHAHVNIFTADGDGDLEVDENIPEIIQEEHLNEQDDEHDSDHDDNHDEEKHDNEENDEEEHQHLSVATTDAVGFGKESPPVHGHISILEDSCDDGHSSALRSLTIPIVEVIAPPSPEAVSDIQAAMAGIDNFPKCARVSGSTLSPVKEKENDIEKSQSLSNSVSDSSSKKKMHSPKYLSPNSKKSKGVGNGKSKTKQSTKTKKPTIQELMLTDTSTDRQKAQQEQRSRNLKMIEPLTVITALSNLPGIHLSTAPIGSGSLQPQPPSKQKPSSVSPAGQALGHRSVGVPSFKASKVVDAHLIKDRREGNIYKSDWETLAHVDPKKYGFGVNQTNVTVEHISKRGYCGANVFGSEGVGSFETKHDSEIQMEDGKGGDACKMHLNVTAERKEYRKVLNDAMGSGFSKNMFAIKPSCSLLGGSVYKR